MTLARGRVIKHSERPPAVTPESSANGARELAMSAAYAMKAKARDADSDERHLDRTVALARVLAERLLLKSLELSPEEIVPLARTALGEALAARRVELFVNPSHVSLLETATETFDPDRRVHAVRGDASLGPGDVRLETDLGIVEARVGVALDQLAERLRDALRP